MNKYYFLLERRLKEISPDLHQRFSDTVFALQQILSNYKLHLSEQNEKNTRLLSKCG